MLRWRDNSNGPVVVISHAVRAYPRGDPSRRINDKAGTAKSKFLSEENGNPFLPLNPIRVGRKEIQQQWI